VLQDLSLELEDEIGIWLGLKGKKVAVDEARHRTAVRRHRIYKGKEPPNPEEEAAEKLLPEGVPAGPVQVRGAMAKGADKRRITIMPRLILKNVVQGLSKEKRLPPKGELLKMLLLVPGDHCSLDFIDILPGGKAVWNRDWDYEYMGEQQQFWKGDGTKNKMKAWVDLKRKMPELFEGITVMMQPAAVRDSIITGWCTKQLGAEKPHGVVQQHDLVGSQTTAGVKKIKMHMHILECIIAAEMTACSQVTDIMCAKKTKTIAHNAAPEIKKWLKRKAAHNSEEVKYAIGPVEMMMLANKIHEGLQAWLQESDWILAGCRQGGHLAYLPDLKAGRLRPVEDFLEEWKENLHLEKPPVIAALGGGGNKLDPEWLLERFEWLNADGRAPPAPWHTEEEGADERVKKQIVYAKQKLDEHSILICADEEELFQEDEAMRQLHPAYREAKNEADLKRLFPAAGEAGSGKISTKVKDAASKQHGGKAVQAKKPLQEDYKEKVKVLIGEGASRQELADKVQLAAKPKKPSRVKQNQAKEAKKAEKGKKTCHGKFLQKMKQQKKSKEKVAKLKEAMKEWMEKQPEFAKKDLVGQFVRIAEDQPPAHRFVFWTNVCFSYE